jgi:hypothetical protein
MTGTTPSVIERPTSVSLRSLGDGDTGGCRQYLFMHDLAAANRHSLSTNASSFSDINPRNTWEILVFLECGAIGQFRNSVRVAMFRRV